MVLRQEEWCTASWQKPPVSSASEAKLPNWRAQELLQREGWALLHSGSNSCWGGRHRTERTFQVVLLCSYSSSVPVRPLEAKGDWWFTCSGPCHSQQRPTQSFQVPAQCRMPQALSEPEDKIHFCFLLSLCTALFYRWNKHFKERMKKEGMVMCLLKNKSLRDPLWGR